jgi:hypothetical protein
MTERKANLPNPNNQEGSRENASIKNKVGEILHTRSKVRGGVLFASGVTTMIGGRVLGEESLTTAGTAAALFGAADLTAEMLNPPKKK